MATIVAQTIGGNWNNTATWNTGTIPTAADDVQLSGVSGNVTINVSSVCRSLDCTGYTGTLTRSQTLTIGDATAGLSSVALRYVGTMTLAGTGNTVFASSSATQQSITLAGFSLGTATFSGTGSWQMQDAFTATGVISHTAGSIDVNGQTVTGSSSLTSTGSTTRSLTFGAASVTATTFTFAATGLTVSAASATFNSNANATHALGGFTFGTLNLTSAGLVTVTGANTFTNFTCAKSGFNVASGLTLGANQTVTGTLTLTGVSNATARMLVQSDTVGTSRTLSAGTVVASYVDFQDIAASGAASWDLHAITGLSGDCGGNSGITFTAATTTSPSGTASFTWSTASWSVRNPLPQDTALINNSFVAGRTITVDMSRLGNVTCTCTGNPVLSFSQATTLFGNLTLATGMTTSGSALTLQGRGSQTVTSNGVTVTQAVTFNAPGGSYALQDDFVTNGALTHQYGTLDANGHNITMSTFTSNISNTRAIVFGSGTWNLTTTASGIFWSIGQLTSLTVTPGTATIKVTTASANSRTFSGQTKTYPTLDYTVAGSTGSLVISGIGTTFNGINFSDASNARTLSLVSTNTYTFNAWNVNGTAGNLVTVSASTAGSASNVVIPAGGVSSDYLSIKDIHSTGGTFYAGANSVDVSGNTGITFTAPPAPGSSKTQTGLARIANSFTKTQTGLGRVANNVTKTQTGLAHITAKVTKTQLAVGRIATKVTVTQSAKARIAVILSTDFGHANYALASIANVVQLAQTAVARVNAARTRAQTGTAHIKAAVTKTQSARADIAVGGRLIAQMATAKVVQFNVKSQSAVARIQTRVPVTTTAKARLAQTYTKTQTSVGRVAQRLTATQSARATLRATFIGTKSQAAKALVAVTGRRTQTARATISIESYQFQPPATIELPRTRVDGTHRHDRFWNYIRRGKVGSTVLKNQDGTYSIVNYPSQDQIAAAAIVYMGGHVHNVSAAERASLIAAGFSVDTVVVTSL